MPTQQSQLDSVSVGVPISVTIIVPIDVPGFEVDTTESHGDFARIPVVDCTKAENGAELIAAATLLAKDDEACKCAQIALMSAVQLHRKEYPIHQATITLYGGVMEEVEI